MRVWKSKKIIPNHLQIAVLRMIGYLVLWFLKMGYWGGNKLQLSMQPNLNSDNINVQASPDGNVESVVPNSVWTSQNYLEE